MRDTKANDWFVQKSSGVALRALRLATIALGIGLVVSAGAARAGDDEEEDDSTFEQKIIKNIMTGIGGTNMENQGINYRERSPLVVPPRIDLPPPATSGEINAPNWPRDPDVQRRRAALEAAKKDNKDPGEAARVLMPSELAKGKVRAKRNAESNAPGDPSQSGYILSPSQLGYTGGLMGMFKGNQAETAPFKGEPTRDALTMPPPGYQTPSPNFAYGTGPKESLNKDRDPSAGKY